MRALIVDDQRIARQELLRLLAAHPEIDVAGEARTGEEARRSRPPGRGCLQASPPRRPDLSGAGVRQGRGTLLARARRRYLPAGIGRHYTRIHFAREGPLVQRSLAALQERLDPATLFRAGRKHVVNLKWVERIEPAIGGNLLVVL